MIYDERTQERFWAKVDKSGPCWLWTAAKNRNGYGLFNVRPGKQEVAHRVAFKLHGRDIPPGLECDHLCRVRHCVKPLHLELVTGRENKARGDGCAAVNSRRIVCARGHEDWATNARGRYCRTCKRVCSDKKLSGLRANTMAKK